MRSTLLLPAAESFVSSVRDRTLKQAHGLALEESQGARMLQCILTNILRKPMPAVCYEQLHHARLPVVLWMPVEEIVFVAPSLPQRCQLRLISFTSIKIIYMLAFKALLALLGPGMETFETGMPTPGRSAG